MDNIECKLVEGLYLSNYETDKQKSICFAAKDIVNSPCLYLRYTEDLSEHFTIKEKDLENIAKKLLPDEEIDAISLYCTVVNVLGNHNEKVKGSKCEKNDGMFLYSLRNWRNSIVTTPFSHTQDLSFDKPEDCETMKYFRDLEWPSLSGDQTDLAELMRIKGYSVVLRGNSGFASKREYVIKPTTIDERNIPETIETIKKDIKAAEKELLKKEHAQADEEFAKNKLDVDGIFSYLELGGGPSDLHNYDKEKYGEIGSKRIKCCQDHRQNITHIYCVLLYDKEKLQKTDKHVIELSSAMGLEGGLQEISAKHNIYFKVGNSTYIVNGSILRNVSHLDLDLNNPQDVQKALTQDKLRWPCINATETILKDELEKKGYVLEYQGRSGIARKNNYEIKTEDGIISPDVVEQIKKDLEQAKISVENIKKQNFDSYFDEQSTDKAKVYAVVETGYDYDQTRVVDSDKYESVAKMRIACTSDYRYGRDHTYAELLINKERINKDPREFIVLEVPKDMIGLVIGKGGSNIKAMQQKFSKGGSNIKAEQQKFSRKFKVVQDPREIAAEKKRQEEEVATQRQYALQSLEEKIKNFMGNNFTAADDESIAVSMVEYITNNQNNLSVSPTQEELMTMQEHLIVKRDEEIKRENERKAAEIAHQKQLEEQRIAEQKRLEQEKIAEITKAVKEHIQTWADEHEGKVLPNEELVKFLKETYKEDDLAQKFTGTIQTDFLLKMEEERAMQKRFAEAEKQFDRVVLEEFQNFLEDDNLTGGHGYNYFNAVGKARRGGGFEAIAIRVERRLGIYEDLHKPLEERLLDHRPPEDRWSSYLDEDTKFCNRIEEFYENIDDFESYLQQQEEKNNPQPPSEPTIENLAALWGAKIR